MLKVDEQSRAGLRLVATTPFAAGQTIAPLHGRVVERADYRSIQIGVRAHLDVEGDLACLNHSCAPNTVVDVERMRLVAARDIAANEELTFFYPSTEWEMAQPFTCLCGAAACIGVVAGARRLDPAVLRRYALSPHIRHLAGLDS